MERRLVGEVMDQPDIDPAEHRHALRSLNRANKLFGVDRRLWRHVRKLACKDCCVLDIACGGGGFLHYPRRKAVLEWGLLVGIDRSLTALKFAAGRGSLSHKDARHSLRKTPLWIAGDALRLPLADGSIDVAVCSLFLHHFEEPQIVTILQEAERVARRAVVVGELVRSWPAWMATYAATRLLSRSWIFHADGPRSVRAAFRARELRELATKAGLPGARVRRVFPFRYIMTWQRPTTSDATG